MRTVRQKILTSSRLLLSGLVLLLTARLVLAQGWQASYSPKGNWPCIACTPDGTKMIAAQFPGSVFISTNSGLTWKITSNRNKYWCGVAITPDGSKLLAAAAGFPDDDDVPGGIYTSTNYGYTWTSYNFPKMYWSSVALSADGQTLAATAAFGKEMMDGLGGIFTSTNGGRLWKSHSFTNAFGKAISLIGLAASADGQKMFAVAPLYSYRSTNLGATWTQLTNAPTIDSSISPSQYIASSADGRTLVMCETRGTLPEPHIWVSTNSGDTWTKTTAPGNDWKSVAISADGKTMAATLFEIQVPVLLSRDGGETWTADSQTAVWNAVAISSNGCRVAASMGGGTEDGEVDGQIYIRQQTPP